MANNRNLLKEAIADAKAVKETAIANAKAALEESFGPFLREKLSQKISEMEETDENMGYENSKMEKENMMDEVSLDELLAELEEGEVEEELYEAKKEEKEEEEDENISIEDMSEDDLKSFIESVIKDMVANKELEAGHEGMENEEGAKEGTKELDERNMYSKKRTTKMANHGEEIDLNELLNELELEEETLNEMASFYKIKDSVDITKNGEKKTLSKSEIQSMFKRVADATPKGSAMHDILDSLAATGEADLKKFSMEQGGKDMAKWNNVPNRNKLEKDGVFAKYLDAGSSPSNKGGQGRKGGTDAKYDFFKDEDGGEEFTQDLEEAYSVIKTLKSELNEINVLNAKLLYTNKIFRNKSLTEQQKIKVLTAFDRATSKKEVELIYETLQGLKTSNVTKSPIRESLSSASRALGSVSAKPIIENDAFARMRELAFGKK